MIVTIVNAIKGPILSVLSGCLGESGFGNDIPKDRYSQGFAKQPRNKLAEHIVHFSGND